MAAYGLSCRFAPPPPCTRFLDPGAYDTDVEFCLRKKRLKECPFLSKAPRNTLELRKPYTEKIYDSAIPHRIPNCTSFMSKRPRFPYQAFSKKDLEEILCRCGLDDPCECPTEEEEEVEVVCQAKVPRRLFTGPPPHSALGGLSCPSKRDRGFKEMPDGSMRRLLDVVKEESPPFYDTRVTEPCAFYHGCKWSKWTSKRSSKSIEVRPGPADYTLDREITPEEKCYQMIRAYRRRTAKLGQSSGPSCVCPGPADYSPQLPKCPGLKFLGPKAKRFLNYENACPGPADYSVKRDFDSPNIPHNPRYSTLPLAPPPCFGTKGARFKYRETRSPSPADYNANVKLCRILYCGSRNAPFNCSAKRFQDTKMDYEDYDDEDENEIKSESDDEDRPQLPKPRECPQLTSQFRSKALRFKTLHKKLNEPSPADLGPDMINKKNEEKTAFQQIIAPFLSSQGRFQRWYNWMPIHNVHFTPGPGYYNCERPKCYPAVPYGPMCRAQRFPVKIDTMPAPNEYKITRGVDDVLATTNRRLLDNMKNQHKFQWKVQDEPRKLDFKERELALLDKAIANLSTTDFMRGSQESIKQKPVKEKPEIKPKLLRCFLYRQQVKPIS